MTLQKCLLEEEGKNITILSEGPDIDDAHFRRKKIRES
jgi:hypothetical protein